MRTFALFGAKTSDFSKILVCLHGQGGRGLSQCGQGGGREESIFHNFVRTSFMDGPLLILLVYYSSYAFIAVQLLGGGIYFIPTPPPPPPPPLSGIYAVPEHSR